jgi:hypothetical protein
MLQTLIYELIILLLILFFIYIIFKNIFTTREYFLKSISKGFKKTISNPISSGTKTATNTVSNTTNTAINTVSNTATKVIDTSKDFGANITDGAYDLGNEIKEAGQQIQGILGDALSSLLSSVYALNNTFNAISSNLQSITS